MKSQVMKLAHQIKKQEGVNISTAMKKAWAIMKNKGDNKMSVLDMIKEESAKIKNCAEGSAEEKWHNFIVNSGLINKHDCKATLERDMKKFKVNGREIVKNISRESLIFKAQNLFHRTIEIDNMPFLNQIIYSYSKAVKSFIQSLNEKIMANKEERGSDEEIAHIKTLATDLLFIYSMFSTFELDLSNEKFTGLESYSNKADDDNLVQNFWSTHKAAKAGSADAIKSRKALAQEILSKNIDMGDFNNFVKKTANS